MMKVKVLYCLFQEQTHTHAKRGEHLDYIVCGPGFCFFTLGGLDRDRRRVYTIVSKDRRTARLVSPPPLHVCIIMQTNNVEMKQKISFFWESKEGRFFFILSVFLVFHLAMNTRQSGRALSVTILLLFLSSLWRPRRFIWLMKATHRQVYKISLFWLHHAHICAAAAAVLYPWKKKEHWLYTLGLKMWLSLF